MNVSRAVLCTVSLALLPSLATAQCAPGWTVDSGFGTDGEVHCAIEWDPDGAGPALPQLVIGGTFSTVAGTPANNLARIDLQSLTATPFGSGANAVVRSLAVGAAGELIAGGAFTQIDGVAAVGVARLVGGMWLPFGTGVDIAAGGPLALLPQPAGALVVGGRLQSAGGAPVESVARWDGTGWSALGAGLRPYDAHLSVSNEPGGVRALVPSPSGFFAVGLFDASGSMPIYAVAEWNGTAWQHVGALSSSPLVVLTGAARGVNGDLHVCGVGFLSFVWRWDGTTWTQSDLQIGTARVLAPLPTGEIVAGATSSGFYGPVVERWNGSSWQALGADPTLGAQARILTVAPLPSLGNRAIVVGGRNMTQLGGVSAQSLLLYADNTGWRGHPSAFDTSTVRLAIGPDGDVLAFRADSVGTTPVTGIVRRAGSSWVPVPQSPSNTNCVAFDHQGRMLATNGSSTVYRAIGAGSSGWTGLNTGSPSIDRVAVLPNGTIVAVNSNGSASYGGRYLPEGGTWQDLGGCPSELGVLPNGNLVGAGPLGTLPFSSRVGTWDGTAWTNLDPTVSINGVPEALAVLPDGAVVVGGPFTFGNGVAWWRGSNWQGMGAGFNGPVRALAVLADGRLVARGDFTASGTVACAGSAVWDGQAWQPLPGAPSGGLSMAAHPNGDLWMITALRETAAWRSPCAAAASSVATACSNAGAAGRLESRRWPLVGSECRSLVTGLPANAFAVAAFGFLTSSVPLASLLPQAAPGCELQVIPDMTMAVYSQTRFASFDLGVPLLPSLSGLQFHEQVVVLDVTGATGIAGVSSTNRLTLTVGSHQ